MGWKKWIPKEVRKPISSVVDFIDEDILDPAGEFLEEEILDPAGEWLGEEVAQPIRKELSSWMPNELQAFAGTLGGIGGGKLGYLIAGMMTGNPYLIALGAGLGAAAGDIVADYSTTDENVEWDPNYVSAALSGATAGLGSFKGADAVKGTDKLAGQTVDPGKYNVVMEGPPGQYVVGSNLANAPNISLQGGEYVSSLGANAPGYAQSVAAADAANQAASYADALTAGDLLASTKGIGEGLTGMEALGNIGTEFVTGAQPYVDPFGMYGTADPGTLAALTGSGDLGFNMATAESARQALTGIGTKVGIEAGVNYYDAMQLAEEEYDAWLRERGFTIEQIKAQNKSERMSYLIRSMKNWNYPDEQIAQALVDNEYISSVEEYDPSLGAETREWGESIYAANGGRIGYFNGTQPQETLPSQGNPYDFQTGGKTDSMGIGNYIETEKLRSRWMDKVERMLQHKKANMQTNDPGLFGRMGNVANIFNNERTWDTREERAFPDMEKRYRQTIQQMERDQANDDWKMMERTKNQVGGYLDMLDNRYANMKKGGRINYNMGTRRTPEGDPISPDVPAGMQMDLRG